MVCPAKVVDRVSNVTPDPRELYLRLPLLASDQEVPTVISVIEEWPSKICDTTPTCGAY